MVRLSVLCLLLGLYRVQSLRFPDPVSEPACGYANRDILTFGNLEEDTAEEAELPWMVILLDARNSQPVGGGSLIKPDVVLSATTVTRNFLENQLIVRAGEWDLSSDFEMRKHEDVTIRKIVRHPDFQEDSGANNVALLFLERPLQRTRHINLICMPPLPRPIIWNRCIVSGWGINLVGSDTWAQARLQHSIKSHCPTGSSRCQRKLTQTKDDSEPRAEESYHFCTPIYCL
ncbi:phenoloxidase-activating factor 2-like isoform X2 [Drosophila suzukii]|uniref:Phenoloxidase-activating factor 2-like isoform X2 n=1 Tax=Drosophila suzukii TaxID=28584 RepID=A0ABM4TP05_DROSZ